MGDQADLCSGQTHRHVKDIQIYQRGIKCLVYLAVLVDKVHTSI